MENVEDAAVSSEANSIMGQVVKAKVKVNSYESAQDFKKRMRTFCRNRLSKYKIPQRVIIVSEEMHGGRFKKMRNK
jgi:acyl-coenzyme A synthetase/AMP-(fatty) acid ligase